MNLHHAILDHAAASLGDLDVVFIGGAALPLLYEEDVAARETNDADCIVLVQSRAELAVLEARLRRRGLRQPLDREGPICRWWTADDQVIDVMPVSAEVLGFSNRWYEGAFHNAMPVVLGSGRVVKVAAAPWLLATKIEAFRSRGASFPYGSKDLEDILTLVRGRPTLAVELRELRDAPLRRYLLDFLGAMLTWPELPDLVDGHMEAPRTERRRQATLRQLGVLVDSLRAPAVDVP